MILTLVPQFSASMLRGTSPSMGREMYDCRRAENRPKRRTGRPRSSGGLALPRHPSSDRGDHLSGVARRHCRRRRITPDGERHLVPACRDGGLRLARRMTLFQVGGGGLRLGRRTILLFSVGGGAGLRLFRRTTFFADSCASPCLT